MVDFLKEHMPTPINRLPQWYPYMRETAAVVGSELRISDGRARARAITATLWPTVSRFARGIVNRHPSDLIVSVHPLATSFILRALGRNRPPFMTVVTDMVTTHALWFDQRADLICVPTEIARFRAIEYGMEAGTGRHGGAADCRALLRSEWAIRPSCAANWAGRRTNSPPCWWAAGSGMGLLAQTARAINESGLDLFLAVVAGRNERLKRSLEDYSWNMPARIYGFTRDMPDFMRAADVLITKAGPGTIAEALNAHLPHHPVCQTARPGRRQRDLRA